MTGSSRRNIGHPISLGFAARMADGQILAFPEDVRTEAEGSFIITFLVLIIMEKPVVAAVLQPAISLLRIIRMEPEHAAGFPVRAPAFHVQFPGLIDRRDDDVALVGGAGRNAWIAGELKCNPFQGHGLYS